MDKYKEISKKHIERVLVNKKKNEINVDLYLKNKVDFYVNNMLVEVDEWMIEDESDTFYYNDDNFRHHSNQFLDVVCNKINGIIGPNYLVTHNNNHPYTGNTITITVNYEYINSVDDD